MGSLPTAPGVTCTISTFLGRGSTVPLPRSLTPAGCAGVIWAEMQKIRASEGPATATGPSCPSCLKVSCKCGHFRWASQPEEVLSHPLVH